MDSRSGTQNKEIVILAICCLLILVGMTRSVAAEDRINLDDISIKGSRELPKVLYIVPWKSARLGSLSVSAGSQTLDTEMEALDRYVFRRQVKYYGMLYGEESGTK